MQKGIKWITVAVLASSAVFFVLPYRFGVSPFEGILGLFGVVHNSAVYSFYGATVLSAFLSFLMVALFGTPLLLTLIAAFIMSRKYSIGKCIAAAILSTVAFSIYFIYFDSSFIKGATGLIGNMAVAAAGIVLPIACIAANKKTETHKPVAVAGNNTAGHVVTH